MTENRVPDHHMGHRRIAAAAAVAVLLVLSGCIGFLTGEESLAFESEPVAVTDAALEETGYEEQRQAEEVQNRTFSVAGQDRQVRVTNHLTEYARGTDALLADQQAARFTAYSTPEVKIAGQGPFNPVGDLSNRELALQLQEQYDSIENVRPESNRTVSALGNQTRVSKFRANATLTTGAAVEVFIHVTKFRHEGDYVIAVAVHPTELDEQSNVDRLIRGIDHPA